MDFNFTETQHAIIDAIKKLGEQYIAPHVLEWDEQQFFPIELFRKLGEQGFMGVLIPEHLGGAGLTYDEYVVVVDQISQFCPAIGLSVAAHNSLCTNHIYKFGNDAQRQQWLPKLATGEWIGAWGLTEQNSGSDAGGMNTVAVKQGQNWVLNGSKNFITHGKSGDVAVVIARTGEKGASGNSTAFVIERGTAGFTSGKVENKLGMRASETAEMVFTDCIISDDQRLGEVGEGFKQALTILDGGRISIAALSLGVAKGAYQKALQYSGEREQFGQAIRGFQAIGFKLAEMATEIEASELLIYKAASMINQKIPMTKMGAMAKYYASEACVRISNEAVQILGGYGYTKDYGVEKFYRDSKLCTIGEGTTEIQKLVIERYL